MTKLNLKTFSSQNKPLVISKEKEKSVVLKTQQNFFNRLLTVSRSRQVDLKEVLKFELTSVPLSIFHLSGEMRKINKSQLLKEL